MKVDGRGVDESDLLAVEVKHRRRLHVKVKDMGGIQVQMKGRRRLHVNVKVRGCLRVSVDGRGCCSLSGGGSVYWQGWLVAVKPECAAKPVII